MARVNISQASRLTGKSRTTIHRKLKSGELSIRDGQIDTSELLRVFGAFVTDDDTVPPPVQRVSSEQALESVHLLQVQLAAAQREIELLKESHKEIIERIDKGHKEIIEEKDKVIALLEYRPNMSENSKPNMSENSVNEMSEKPSKENWKEQRKKEGRLMKLARFVFDE